MSGSESSSPRGARSRRVTTVASAGGAGPSRGDGVFAGSAVAAVTGWDGALIAEVSRRMRPGEPGEPGPEVVVGIQGDLDLDTAPLAHATLIQALDDAPRVCLDLSEVRFFGAAGLRVIVGARQHAESLGRAFRLSGVHGVTERILVLTGLYPPG